MAAAGGWRRGALAGGGQVAGARRAAGPVPGDTADEALSLQQLYDALQEGAAKEQMKVSIERDELSPFAGALGAAIWGGVRHNYLERQRAKDTQVMMDVGA